ncbi:vWA domain-containing protein, partial [Arsenicicoccus sp. UBA2120]
TPAATPAPAAPVAPPVPAAPAQPVPSSIDTPAPQDDKAKLLPFYLVCDVSHSMVESGALTEANNILPSLVQALEKDPIICDKVRFGVMDFSDDARMVLPLCDLLEQTTLPQLEGRGRTSYKAAFDLLRTQIERDVNQLKADGFAVHRPAVFFLSDGAPTDAEPDWKAAFAALTQYDKASGTGNRMYPNIIPFGLQGADPRILQEVIHPKNPPERAMRLFMADQDQTAASAVTKMAKLLVTSVIQSSTGLAQGSNGIVLPKAEDGVKSYAADDDVFL